MNRIEKRKLDRLEQWFNSLSDDKKQMIYDIINEKIDTNNNLMSTISDICTVSALDDVLNVSISDIKDIIIKTKEYMVDYGEYLEREKNGGIKMIENVELRERVKTKIKMYMLGKMDKARGLKLLKGEFNLPNAELSDLWLECKNGNCSKEIDRVPENTTTVEEGLDIEQNVVTKVIERNFIPEKKISLKVIRVTTEVKGEYGTYIKDVDGVKINGRLYGDKDMVKKEKIKIAAEYKVKMDNIEDKIKVLHEELSKIQESGMKEIEKFTEIESVFNL